MAAVPRSIRERVAGRLRAAADLLAPAHGYAYIAVDTYLVHYRLGEAFDCLVEVAGDEEPPQFWSELAAALADLTTYPALGWPKRANVAACERRSGPTG